MAESFYRATNFDRPATFSSSKLSFVRNNPPDDLVTETPSHKTGVAGRTGSTLQGRMQWAARQSHDLTTSLPLFFSKWLASKIWI